MSSERAYISDADTAVPADADSRYALAVELLGAALARLAAGYEANPAERQDLLQDIHLQLWRSLARFDGRCSLRTWVYRVAHNVAADHVARSRRRGRTASLDDADAAADKAAPSHEAVVSDRLALSRVYDLLYGLAPLDRQVMLLHLEGESAATTAEVCGLSSGAVATRIHRLKRFLAEQFKGEAQP
ncbi:RNA polymerase sigma factor [Pseudochelatococcus sp. B33]